MAQGPRARTPPRDRAGARRCPQWKGTPRTRARRARPPTTRDRKSTRLNSSHLVISYAVFCLKKKNVNMVLSPELVVAFVWDDGKASARRSSLTYRAFRDRRQRAPLPDYPNVISATRVTHSRV